MQSMLKTTLRWTARIGLPLSILFGVYLYAQPEEAVIPITQTGKLNSLFSGVTIDGIIASIFALVMAFVSAHFYNHKGRRYAQDKSISIDTPGSFRYVYRYIQITTIVAGIGSFLTAHSLFLELHENPVLLYTGIAIATGAMALFVTAKLNLGEHYSPCFDSLVPRDIVQDGLYKYIRHPIYTANILLLIGMTVATGSLWIGLNLVLLTIYYVLSAYKEEEVLQKHFPNYRRYMEKTNMLIPSPRFFRTTLKNQTSH